MLSPKFDSYVFSEFTREKGFVNIHSNSIKRRKCVSILNNFIPQGASPEGSIRISQIQNDLLGVGFYQMQSHSRAKILTLLSKVEGNRFERFMPPLDTELSEITLNHPLSLQMNTHYGLDFLYPIWDFFESKQIASLLYSILTGDNILLVDPKTEKRIQFFATLLSISPRILFSYNRITTGCLELDGNENIVGVDELPQKYRSHKKLYLPLDTIFIDLKNHSVDGEGLKFSEYTLYLADILQEDNEIVYSELQQFLKRVVSQKPSLQNSFSEKDHSLISRIESKLGIGSHEKEEWIMF